MYNLGGLDGFANCRGDVYESFVLFIIFFLIYEFESSYWIDLIFKLLISYYLIDGVIIIEINVGISNSIVYSFWNNVKRVFFSLAERVILDCGFFVYKNFRILLN